jgi:hypothetical protein
MGMSGPTLAGGEEGGERDLVVLDPGDVLDDALTVGCVQVSMRNVKWVLNVVVISAPCCPSPLPLPASRRCIRRRSRGPRLGLGRCVGQVLATEAIAECIRSGGVWEAESNIDLLDLVSIPPAADWDTSFTVKCIDL